MLAEGTLATLLDALIDRGEERGRALRFVLQHAVAMLAWSAGVSPAGRRRLAGAPCGDPVALTPGEQQLLARAREGDWSQVEPTILGALFQRGLGAATRRAIGAHFTREAEIHKVIGPTIERPWRERIGRARTAAELGDLHRAMLSFRVLDPACGSGDFLYFAHRALKRLEAELFARMREGGVEPGAVTVSVQQLHGIDRDPLAVELSRVSLVLAQGRMEDLDDNIRCDDALFCAWPRADAIIGNPPFQSKNKAQRALGRAYMNRVREAYPEVPGHADYCVYWFRRAHDELPEGGRAGLVGTDTIRQNKSRVGGLDHIVKNGGTITEAVSTQVWPGEAVLRVSIVNWIKGAASGGKVLHEQLGDRAGSPWVTHELPAINASLSPRADLTTAVPLAANLAPKTTFQGQTPGHTEGFVIEGALSRRWIEDDPANADVLFPYLIGDDMLDDPDGAPDRALLDFGDRDIVAASRYARPFEHVEALVRRAREEAAGEEAQRNAEALAADPRARVNRHHAGFLRRWWRLSFRREDMLRSLAKLRRYIACSRVTRRPVFEIVPRDVRPGDALQVFALEDDYSFGVLQSDVHWRWFKERCSGLKIDPRYTSESVYATFPWPQAPTAAQVREVGAAGVALHGLRRSISQRDRIGLRALYRVLDAPGAHPLRDAHERLDDAVRAAYGIIPDADPLAFLLDLNHALSAREAAGASVTGPGLPRGVMASCGADSLETRGAFG